MVYANFNMYWMRATINNNINNPSILIRNGQPSNILNDGWIPITEDINKDQSSIYLTSNQKNKYRSIK